MAKEIGVDTHYCLCLEEQGIHYFNIPYATLADAKEEAERTVRKNGNPCSIFAVQRVGICKLPDPICNWIWASHMIDGVKISIAKE
jgi:hypothetical protein